MDKQLREAFRLLTRQMEQQAWRTVRVQIEEAEMANTWKVIWTDSEKVLDIEQLFQTLSAITRAARQRKPNAKWLFSERRDPSHAFVQQAGGRPVLLLIEEGILPYVRAALAKIR